MKVAEHGLKEASSKTSDFVDIADKNTKTEGLQPNIFQHPVKRAYLTSHHYHSAGVQFSPIAEDL